MFASWNCLRGSSLSAFELCLIWLNQPFPLLIDYFPLLTNDIRSRRIDEVLLFYRASLVEGLCNSKLGKRSFTLIRASE